MNPAALARIPSIVCEAEKLGGRLLVLFDGHCVLCNGLVRWFLRRDRRDRLRFAPFSAEGWGEMLMRHGLGAADAESGASTIYVVQNFGDAFDRVVVRSDAALAMLRELPRPWPAIAFALRLIPRALRDLAYRLVARWRYRIWGRLESCPIPTAEERERFIALPPQTVRRLL